MPSTTQNFDQLPRIYDNGHMLLDWRRIECPFPGWRYLDLDEIIVEGDAYWNPGYAVRPYTTPTPVTRRHRIGRTVRESHLHPTDPMAVDLGIVRQRNLGATPKAMPNKPFRYPLNKIQSEPLPLP